MSSINLKNSIRNVKYIQQVWKTCYGGNQYATHVRFGWDEISLTVLTTVLNELLDLEPVGEVVVTTKEDGECVLVSRQDEDHNILKVIWEKK